MSKIDYNKVYDSNQYGKYIILGKVDPILNDSGNNKKQIKIKFLQTGTELITYRNCAINGQVRDPFYPIYYGVAYTGNVKNPTYHILYEVWHNMIRRCYNKDNPRYKDYGGIGITVDPRWHCFEYFIYDCQFLLNYDKFLANPKMYHLDKDYLQQHIPKEQRVYSKDTCVFLNKYDNSNLMAIETKHKHNNKYFGVAKNGENSYNATYIFNKTPICSVLLDNEIAAANVYNTYAEKYDSSELVPLRNDVPYMSTEEVMSHIISNRDLIKNVQ